MQVLSFIILFQTSQSFYSFIHSLDQFISIIQLNQNTNNTMENNSIAPIVQKKLTDKLVVYIEAINRKMGRQNFGLLLMGLSQIIWPLSFLYPSEKNMNPIQTNLIRSIVTMISHYFIIKYFDFNFDIKDKGTMTLVAKRNFIVTLHQFVLTGSLFVLPYPIVFTLNSSCVLFVFVIDYLLFNVKINKQQIVGVILGFIGVLLTVNGQYLINQFYPEREKQTDFKNYITDDPLLKLLAAIVLVLINFFRAYALSITKTIKKINGFQLSFHFGSLLLFECAMLYPITVIKQSSISDLLCSVVYCGIPQNIVQVLFMSAIILSKNTGITNLMCFLTIAIGYFISLVRYNQNLNQICLVGVGFIFYGIFRTLNNRQQHQK